MLTALAVVGLEIASVHPQINKAALAELISHRTSGSLEQAELPAAELPLDLLSSRTSHMQETEREKLICFSP